MIIVLIFLFYLSLNGEVFYPPRGENPDAKWEEDFGNFCCYDDYPYVSQQTFKFHADHLFDESGLQLETDMIMNGDTIYVNNFYLEFFFNKVHPSIKSDYILISGMNDWTLPGKFLHYLDDKKLIAWFATNAELIHEKIFQIPIGIPYQYIKNYDNNDLENQNNNIKNLIIFNSKIENNKNYRSFVYEIFKKKFWCYCCFNKFGKDYLKDLSESRFVISPFGNGVDCFRTWEALLVGSIPIVESSFLDPIYEGLPVLIVNNWNIISPNFLHKKIKSFGQKKTNKNKLYFDYWFNKIREIQDKHRKN